MSGFREPGQCRAYDLTDLIMAAKGGDEKAFRILTRHFQEPTREVLRTAITTFDPKSLTPSSFPAWIKLCAERAQPAQQPQEKTRTNGTRIATRQELEPVPSEISLDQKPDRENPSMLTPADRIGDDHSNPERLLQRKSLVGILKRVFAIAQLTRQEFKVLIHSKGLFGRDKLPKKKIGERPDIFPHGPADVHTVERIEDSAIQKLKQAARELLEQGIELPPEI